METCTPTPWARRPPCPQRSGGRGRTARYSSLPVSRHMTKATYRCPITNSAPNHNRPQVQRVSLHPDKRPKPSAAAAKKEPAKGRLSSGGSKVSDRISALIFTIQGNKHLLIWIIVILSYCNSFILQKLNGAIEEKKMPQIRIKLYLFH